MMLSVHHLYVSGTAQSEHDILKDVSIDLRTASITLIVGEPGSGKSTLLHALAGLMPVRSGEILYNQVPLWDGRSLNEDVIRSVGMVFQHPESQLFAQTVEKELRYSLRPYRLPRHVAEGRMAASLQEVGLNTEYLERFPLQLSGGEKRRIALASTTVTVPSWLFLDEPTAGLDPLGTTLLLQDLQSKRTQQAGEGVGGIVIATHDLDALLPIADAVIILHHGRVLAACTPDELYEHPHVLMDAGIGLPSWLAVTEALRQQGMEIAGQHTTPKEMAQAILQSMQDAAGRRSVASAAQGTKASTGRGLEHASGTAIASVETLESETDPELACDSDLTRHDKADDIDMPPEPLAASAPASWIHTLDVRAKWLSYLLCVVGIFAQHSWVGYVLATGLTLSVAGSVRLPLQQYRVLRPFLWMMILSVALSGLQFGQPHSWHGIGYSASAGLHTLVSFYKILLVILLSVVLTTTTSTLQMKQGLERLWVWKWRPHAVEAITLGSALTLRFIPLMWDEWQRFSKIVRARAKSTTRFGTIRLRDVPAIAIPLILSVIHLGDTIATAMEARGYIENATQSVARESVPFTRTDMKAIVISAVVCVVFAAIGWMFR